MNAMMQACFSPDSGHGVGGGSGGQGGEHKPKIHGFASGLSEHHESAWKRPLNKDGNGATHVRTFQGKITAAGMEFLDRHVNEWLDAHPDASVKFATTQIGEVATATGKEQVLIVQIWV